MTIEIRPGWSYDQERDRLNVHGVQVAATLIDEWLDSLGPEPSNWLRFRREGDEVTVETTHGGIDR